jgi:hypothetical protein
LALLLISVIAFQYFRPVHPADEQRNDKKQPPEQPKPAKVSIRHRVCGIVEIRWSGLRHDGSYITFNWTPAKAAWSGERRSATTRSDCQGPFAN